jgi:membrane-associated phospholipid phosphatase
MPCNVSQKMSVYMIMRIQSTMPLGRACTRGNQKSRHILFRHVVLLTTCMGLFSTNLCAQYRWDEQVLVNMANNRTPGSVGFSKSISNTSNYLSVGIPAIIVAAGAFEHDKETLHKGLYIMESMAVNYAITFGMKNAIKRDRPYIRNKDINSIETSSTPSFPSGHTSQAFATATSLTIAYPKWYVAVPSYLWAGAVGYSRMNLGVHYPSDVAAGALIGAGSAWLTYKANKWIRGKKAAKKGKELKTVW